MMQQVQSLLFNKTCSAVSDQWQWCECECPGTSGRPEPGHGYWGAPGHPGPVATSVSSVSQAPAPAQTRIATVSPAQPPHCRHCYWY